MLISEGSLIIILPFYHSRSNGGFYNGRKRTQKDGWSLNERGSKSLSWSDNPTNAKRSKETSKEYQQKGRKETKPQGMSCIEKLKFLSMSDRDIEIINRISESMISNVWSLSETVTCISVCESTRVWYCTYTAKTIRQESLCWGTQENHGECTIYLLSFEQVEMKQPKQHLYSLLTGDAEITALTSTRIHFQADDEHENDYDDKFPMITLYRIWWSVPERTIKRIDRFQVTTWDTTNLWADHLSQLVIKLLKNRKDQVVKNILMVWGLVDLFDKSADAHWVAMTFDLIMADDDM